MSATGDWLRSRLGRITSGGRVIPEIDGLRFVAILAVVLFHLNGWVTKTTPLEFASPPREGALHLLLRHGWLGVQLFFVISGFVLGLPFAARHLGGGEPRSLRAYYFRRLTRLEPPYLINLIVLGVLIVIVRGTPLGETLAHWLASALYQHDLVYGRTSTINPVAWSLEIEVQFYVLAPLLASLFRVRWASLRRGLIVLLAAVGVAVAHADPAPVAGHGLTLAHHVQFFMGGFLLADLWTTRWQAEGAVGAAQARTASRNAAGDVLAALALSGLVATVFLAGPVELVAPVLLVAVVAGSLRGRFASRALSIAPVVVIGGACYSIYLWHGVLIAALGRVTKGWGESASYPVHLAVQAAVLLPAILLLGLLAFAALERPFMRRDWPRSAWRWLRRRARPAGGDVDPPVGGAASSGRESA